MYPLDVSNPFYYRSHPYRNQLDLPNSAFKNRQHQQFVSEIPKGRQYFQQTNKKHFSNIFNRSQIEQDKVLSENYSQQQIERSRISMEKSYFRSLNVDDIQGAKPNTLISKAVKNREMAMKMMKKEEQTAVKERERTQKYLSRQESQNPSQNNHYLAFSKPERVYKQEQALNKYSRDKSILQNNSVRVLNSNNYNAYDNTMRPNNVLSSINTSQSNKNISQINPEPKDNYHFRSVNHSNSQVQRLKSTLEDQLIQKEHRIRQLQKKLNFQYQNKHQEIHTPQIPHPYPLTYSNYQHNQNPYTNPNPNFIAEPYPQPQYTSQTEPSPKLISNKSSSSQLNNQFNPKNYQKTDHHQLLSFENNLSPFTHNPKQIPIHNQVSIGSNPTQIHNNGINSKRQNQNEYPTALKIDKNNIRMYNPTYLSFQSDRGRGPINTAAKNLLF